MILLNAGRQCNTQTQNNQQRHFRLHNANIPTLSAHNAVVHSKSIQVQSCKGNTTGPKGRDVAAESRDIEKQSLIHTAGGKWNWGIESDKVGGALQSDSRRGITGENYLLLGVWFKRCVERHHPLQHSGWLAQRRWQDRTSSRPQTTNTATILVILLQYYHCKLYGNAINHSKSLYHSSDKKQLVKGTWKGFLWVVLIMCCISVFTFLWSSLRCRKIATEIKFSLIDGLKLEILSMFVNAGTIKAVLTSTCSKAPLDLHCKWQSSEKSVEGL